MKRTALLLCLALCGCSTRVLFVDPRDDVIRIGRARGEYFVRNQNGEWIRATGRLPVGWYALPDAGEKK